MVTLMDRMTDAATVSCFETEMGIGAIVESDGVVWQLTFGHRSAAQALGGLDESLLCEATAAAKNSKVVKRLQAYLAGKPDDFRDLKLAISHLTPFQRRVVDRCRRIPYGQTMSYGHLADAVGAPRAARAVGSVMRCNRFPLLVPCHRVVNSDGSLGNYSAPTGVSMKARLLELEKRTASSKARP